jgi:hypothetical protein
VTLIIRATAWMTIADRTACGRLWKSGIRATKVINTIVAAASDET